MACQLSLPRPQESIGLSHLLHIRNACAKASLENRRSDIDYCAVNKCVARTGNSRDQNPDSRCLDARISSAARSSHGLITIWFHVFR